MLEFGQSYQIENGKKLEARKFQSEMLNTNYYQQDQKFIFHIVTQDETLQYLSSKYNMNTDAIQMINNMSTDLLEPNTILKIPQPFQFLKNSLIKEQQLKKNNEDVFNENIHVQKPNKQYFKKSISFLNNIHSMPNLKPGLISKKDYLKLKLYYQTKLGNIKGELVITKDLLLFYPDLNDDQNQQLFKRQNLGSIKFQLSIDYNDLHSFETIQQEGLDVIVLRLSSVGSINHKVYKKNVMRIKKIKKPIAQIYLYASPEFYQKQFKNQQSYYQFLLESISVPFSQQIYQPDLISAQTCVYFYDIIIDEEEIKRHCQKQNSEDCFMKKCQLPLMSEKSDILTRDMFIEMIDNLPLNLQQREWQLIYSPNKHGTSIELLYRRLSQIESPNILIIKDFDGNVFGAFCSDSWKKQQLFYGNGETFLFTYYKSEKIKTYFWTRKNPYFMHSNSEEGLCIGTGDYYGLYIHPDLDKGYSFPSETYGNDFLTDSKDFLIQDIEIWTIHIEPEKLMYQQ